MTDGQKKAYERLYEKYCIPYSKSPLDCAAVFGKDTPLIAEIGFGMGDVLAETAERFPDRGFLGIEVHRPGVGKLMRLLEERCITNVRIIQNDAVPVLEGMLVEETLSGIHIFFPDPWPKKRHHKRRLLKQDVLPLLERVLKPGGYLYIVSDWHDYAADILRLLQSSSVLRNTAPGFAERRPWRPESSFEWKGKAKGHHIYELFFIKGKNSDMD
jgi:tRNA (guanine-N7-)-methyltransferase